MSESGIIMTVGVVIALPLLVLGRRIRYGRDYRLIAGYNRASSEEKLRYDIEGLADHLGNGLISLGVLCILIPGAWLLGWQTFASVLLGIFLLFAFITVVGGQKFLPHRQHPAPGTPRGSFQRLLQRTLPARAFAAIEAGTRRWVVECKCGALQDFWDTGGIRYKAVGEQRMLMACPSCQKASWQKIRKRRPGETKDRLAVWDEPVRPTSWP
jgi:hypothetical protein